MATQGSTKEKTNSRIKEPRQYNVIMINDDFTTMEFVVKVLTTVFFKPQPEAYSLMIKIHRSDKAVVGIYTYDIAISKKQKATTMAREEGFPLRITCEPE